MNKKYIFGWLCIFILCYVPAFAGTEAGIPQTAPIIAMIMGAKAFDVAAFKGAYSKRIREDKVQGDWLKNINEARKNLNSYFGDYQLNEFKFEYLEDDAPTQENGSKSPVRNPGVLIRHQGKELFLLVVKEGAVWKIDQR